MRLPSSPGFSTRRQRPRWEADEGAPLGVIWGIVQVQNRAGRGGAGGAMPLAVSADGVDVLCLGCYVPLKSPPCGFRLDSGSPAASKPSAALQQQRAGEAVSAEAFPRTDVELFCSGACRAAYMGRRCTSSLRRQLEQLDGAVCATCGLDAAAVCQALTEAPPGYPRSALLQALAPAIAAEPGLATRLLDAPHLAGNVWHADHCVAVHQGGGECTVDNLQVLCVACHLQKTKREAKGRAEGRRKEEASPSKSPSSNRKKKLAAIDQ